MNEFNINLLSSRLCGPTDVTVYMPGPQVGADPEAFYTSGERYKVLWLLHGGNGDRNDWIRFTGLGNLIRDRKLIVVIPNGLNSDFSNHPQFGEGYMFADYFFDELMPFVHNCLPASSAPEDNFLAGASMGALAVWTLALLHPEKFGGLAPLAAKPRNYDYLEPYREMRAGEFREYAAAHRDRIPAGYGNPRAGIWPKEINMICKYPTVGDFLQSYEHTWEILRKTAREGRLTAKLFLIGGTQDPKFQQMRALVEEMGLERVRYDCVEGMGGHGYAYWDQFLPRMFEYFEI